MDGWTTGIECVFHPDGSAHTSFWTFCFRFQKLVLLHHDKRYVNRANVVGGGTGLESDSFKLLFYVGEAKMTRSIN